jgi:energy-converting hydrogenase Eha subunit E
MSRKTLAGDRRRRKTITALWALGIAVVVIFLIYKEMTAVLYILATLSVTVLLLIVAFSDLSHFEANSQQVVQTKNTSSVGNKAS